MKEIQIYENALFGQVRTSVTECGEPLFCLADVCRALALTNPSEVKRRLQQRGVSTTDAPTTNQYGTTVMQQMTFITEPNLYKCIFQSRKKEAEAFQDWVCSEVLPSIRKTGGYMVARADETPEEIMARALVVAKATIERQQKTIEQQKEEIETQKGAVIASQKKEAVYASLNLIADKSRQGLRPISIDEFANYLRRKGYDTGKKRLASWLRKKGYLCRRHGVYDQPSDMALDLLYMETNRIATITCHGVYFSDKVMITSIGRSALFGKFRKDVEAGVIKVGYLGAGEDEEGGAE
jgi:prophage antirepressor-like protein